MNQWSILRKVLGALGLSAEKTDDLIATIQGWLSDEAEAQNSEKKPEPLPYKLRDGILTKAEHSFYHVLLQAVGSNQTLLTKVNLGDIFKTVTPDKSKWRVYRNKIDRKHVDYLLCDAQTMQPLLGIELDDRSHQRKDRQARDKFVDRVFVTAGLPILHVRAAYSYQADTLADQIAQALGVEEVAKKVEAVVKQPEKASPYALAFSAEITSPSPTKTYPKCSAEMLLRTATRGANKGNKFWGCSNYPRCKSTLAA